METIQINGQNIDNTIQLELKNSIKGPKSQNLEWADYQKRLKDLYFLLKAEDEYITPGKEMLQKLSRKLHISYSKLFDRNKALFAGEYYEKPKEPRVLLTDEMEGIVQGSSFPLNNLLKKLSTSPDIVALLLTSFFKKELTQEGYTDNQKECLDFLVNKLHCSSCDSQNNEDIELFAHIIESDSQDICAEGSFISRMLKIFFERIECQKYFEAVFKYIKKDPLNSDSNICTHPMEFDYEKGTEGKCYHREITIKPNILKFTDSYLSITAAPSYRNETLKKRNGVIKFVKPNDIEFYYLTIANFISNEGREAFERDITRIVNFVNGIFERLFRNLHIIPFKVRLMGKILCELSKKKNPNHWKRNQLLSVYLLKCGIIPFIEELENTENSEGIKLALTILEKIALSEHFPQGEILDFLNPYIDSFELPLSQFYDEFLSIDQQEEKASKQVPFKLQTFGLRGSVAGEILDTILDDQTLSQRLPEAKKFVDMLSEEEKVSKLHDYFLHYYKFVPEDAVNQKFVEQLMKVPKLSKDDPESYKHLVHCKAALVSLLATCDGLASFPYSNCKSFEELLITLEETSSIKEMKASKNKKKIGTSTVSSFLRGYMQGLDPEYASDNYSKLLGELNRDLEVKSKELMEKARNIKLEIQKAAFLIKKQRRLVKAEVARKTSKLRKMMVYETADRLRVPVLLQVSDGKLELVDVSQYTQKRKSLRGAKNSRPNNLIELNTIQDFVEALSTSKPWNEMFNVSLDSHHLTDVNAIFCEYFTAAFELLDSEIQKLQEDSDEEEKNEEDEESEKETREEMAAEKVKLKVIFHKYFTELLYKKIFLNKSSDMDLLVLNACTEQRDQILQKIEVPKNMQHSEIWNPIVKELAKSEEKYSCLGKLNVISKILRLLTTNYRLCVGPYTEVGADIGLNLMPYLMVQGPPKRLHSDLIFVKNFLLKSYQAGELGFCLTTIEGVKMWIENLK